MTEIQKYTQHYIVHFKDSESFPPQEVSQEWWEALMRQLNTQEFVLINWSYYNKYEIRVIKPFEFDDTLEKQKQAALEKESPKVQDEFRRRLWKRDIKNLSLRAVKNAIETIKEEI